MKKHVTASAAAPTEQEHKEIDKPPKMRTDIINLPSLKQKLAAQAHLEDLKRFMAKKQYVNPCTESKCGTDSILTFCTCEVAHKTALEITALEELLERTSIYSGTSGTNLHTQLRAFLGRANYYRSATSDEPSQIRPDPSKLEATRNIAMPKDEELRTLGKRPPCAERTHPAYKASRATHVFAKKATVEIPADTMTALHDTYIDTDYDSEETSPDESWLTYSENLRDEIIKLKMYLRRHECNRDIRNQMEETIEKMLEYMKTNALRNTQIEEYIKNGPHDWNDSH